MSSYSTSSTYTRQEDKSVAAAGDAENILGSGAKLQTLAGSTLIDKPSTTSGDIILNTFPQAVQETVGSLIKSVDTAVGSVGKALTTQQIGGESELAKIVMYLVIGGGVIYLASKVFSR